ncbi:hypothetical protein HRW21_34020, partial [Streptomyces lunaelactis]|nr:hypothetical protein [Streptomyces lunaelactis]
MSEHLAVAAGIQPLTTLAGIRPHVPARTVSLHPVRSAPLGAVRISGLCA